MTKVDDKVKVNVKVDDKATNTVKFATFEPLASTERLSTVSSLYMVSILKNLIPTFHFVSTLGILALSNRQR